MPSSMSQKGKSLVARAISGYQETVARLNSYLYIKQRAEHYYALALQWYEKGHLPAACLLLELAIIDYKKIGDTQKEYAAQDWLSLARNGSSIN